MKIVLFGGGSSYTPELLTGLFSSSLPGGEIVLYDISQERLHLLFKWSLRREAFSQSRWKIKATVSLKKALKEASFVISQFRTGGMQARYQDEVVARKYGLLAQETVGVGGWASALRHLPVSFSLAERLAELAPEAVLINFTNPSGLITEGLFQQKRVRKVAGLCNIPINFISHLAKYYRVKPEEVELGYGGLNHLSFVTSVQIKKREKLQEVLKERKLPELQHFSEEDLLKMGCLPSPYFYYYLYPEKAIKKQKKSLRAEKVLKIEKHLFKELKAGSQKLKWLKKRGGAHYAYAAVSLMESLFFENGKVHIINTKNEGTLPFLEREAVVEIPVSMGKKWEPQPLSHPLPPFFQPLLQAVKAFERMTIEAALEKSWEKAIWALFYHPLVQDLKRARKVAEALRKRQSQYLGYLQ